MHNPSATDENPGTALNRRTLLQTAFASSMAYALATQPIAAQTAIETPTTGLQAGMVEIDVNGFALPAYRAMPQGRSQKAGGWPVVLVISEIFGVHAHIADVCRRLAHQGYMALAPALFVRQGDAASYTDIPKLMSEVIAQVPDAQVMADLDATVQWASKNGGNTKRLAITGFCWGGRITWLYTAHNPNVKAGAAWYGRLEGTSNPLTPKHPIHIAAQLHAPVLGLYGEADTGIPQTSVEAMRQALQAASQNPNAQQSEIIVYPEAPHAFHADYRASYRKAPAEDGWTRMLAWLGQHGV